nr:MAG TPA: Single strand binding protein [Caudoviricetes sp.]
MRTTPNGTSVTTFSVAVNKRNKEGEEQQADFFNVTAWRNTAEFITRYFRKANSICVVGALQTRTWTDNQGQKRYITEIVASEAYFVDAKSETQYSTAKTAAPSYTAPAQTAATYIPEAYQTPLPAVPNFSELDDDEELPF